MASGNNNTLAVVVITAIVVAALTAGGFYLMQPKKPQTLGEKLDSAMEEFSKGVNNAAEKFDDRSPAQKAADDATAAAKDLADKAKAAIEGNK